MYRFESLNRSLTAYRLPSEYAEFDVTVASDLTSTNWHVRRIDGTWTARKDGKVVFNCYKLRNLIVRLADATPN